MPGKKLASWLFGALLLALAGFFIWPTFDRMHGEVTVYNMFCKVNRVAGECKRDQEQTSIPPTFKVFPEQQLVIYWIGDNSPTRYSNCAVRDTINWRCRIGAVNEAKTEYAMVDGQYIETVDPPFLPSTNLFYQVPLWRWWYLRIIESIFGQN
ncbi:hypothetical protein [Bradyrhizobium betae]|uniref:Uncharacterized protein n=1 Tax=Bradyrhizobium betae TaxID=244734 RepID=A0A5P6P6T9_9BRAD|nr:hypothetical protein [Bradyrhizobium betae]MCS3731215.1 hypothetical protein [Bradyrhizobium betae]QFI73173.1 hypothetical protein F8237_12670 [Bradyrhizobium betae]